MKKALTQSWKIPQRAAQRKGLNIKGRRERSQNI